MKKKRIEYKIGIKGSNEYCVDSTMLCNDYGKGSELLKVWILHFYKVIFNYGKTTDENVIELFDFLLSLKNMKNNDLFNNLVENNFGEFTAVKMRECAIKISGETFDIVNSGIGINVSFPMKVTHHDIKISIIALSICIWERLDKQEDRQLFLDVVDEVYETKNDPLLCTLKGNVIVPNYIIEKYSERINSIDMNTMSEEPIPIKMNEEVKAVSSQVENNNNIIPRSEMNQNRVFDSSQNRTKSPNGCLPIIVGTFIGFLLGLILAGVIAFTYHNIIINEVEDKHEKKISRIEDEFEEIIDSMSNDNLDGYDSNTVIVEEESFSGDTYIKDGETYLNEALIDEVKAEAHILDWGHAAFDIYNGTEYTIEFAIIEISIYDEDGETVEVRKYREEFFFGFDQYSTESITFDTGITGVGQISDDDSHIPEHLVSWRFVDIIVESE